MLLLQGIPLHPLCGVKQRWGGENTLFWS